MSQSIKAPWVNSVFEAQLPLDHLSAPAPWAGHIPFAFWGVVTLKPRVMVELGSYSGISYFAFCQAIQNAGLSTKAHAIDTWGGDAHAGFYGEAVFDRFVDRHHQYQSFSTYHRTTFDHAVASFPDHSIDLLHIDGLHTYDAVSHDFQTWLPKLTPDAVVLFHDVREYTGDFGVHRFWDELMQNYTGFAFDHSHGLGVLCLSQASVDRFVVHGVDPSDPACQRSLRDVFQFLGEPFELRAALLQSTADLRDRDAQLKHHQQVVHALHQVELLRDRLEVENARLMRWSVLSLLRKLHAVRSKFEVLPTMVVKGREKLRGLMRTSTYVTARATNACRYLVRGDVSGLVARVRQFRRDGFKRAPLKVHTIGLLSVPHTLSVARSFSEALRSMGFDVLDPVTMYRSQSADLWFVFGAQALKRLPPSGRRLIVQLEQTSSARWFTRRYRRVLLNSIGVLDFSQRNLLGLESFGISFPHSYLVRLAGFSAPDTLGRSKDIDVLFYGDPFCERRQRALIVLQSHLDVTVVSDVFGDAMHDLIRRAKVVVNIHYYPDANLETTRLYECLSLGANVVSEVSPDLPDYPDLIDTVLFVANDDFDAMVDAIKQVLESSSKTPPDQTKVINRSQQQLQFDLARLLQGIGVRDNCLEPHLQYALSGSPVVLTLQETVPRYSRAKEYFPAEFQLINGMRAMPGWVGCGLSYQHLAQSALQQSRDALWIFEDDAELPDAAIQTLQLIERFLDSCPGWDVFCGLITRFDSPPVILDVVDFEGKTFVVMDQMMSMVANRYGTKALTALTNWKPDDRDPTNHTIDVYLNRQINRVVTIHPSVFGHAVEQSSTLWGIKNTSYKPLLDAAHEQLELAIREFRESREASEQ